MINLLLDELGSSPYWYLRDGAIDRPRLLGAYTLFSWQVDRYGGDLSIDQPDVRHLALEDPVLHPQAGPEQVEQRFAWSPIDEMLNDIGGRIGYGPSFPESVRSAIASFADRTWQSLSAPQRAVADTLQQVYGSLLSAVALVTGRLSADQFAHAILATSPLHGVFGFPVDENSSTDETHAREYAMLRDAARTALAYLAAADMRTAEVQRLISVGESDRIEFKATALGYPGAPARGRRSAKSNIARTAAAMLSCDGGWIIVGVDDSGRICGLPELAERSIDTVQLALADFLAATLGIPAAARIGMIPRRIDSVGVLVLACPSIGYQATVTEDGVSRRYTRQGPRTVELK